MKNESAVRSISESPDMLVKNTAQEKAEISISKQTSLLYEIDEALTRLQVGAYTVFFAIKVRIPEVLQRLKASTDEQKRLLAKESATRVQEKTNFVVGGYRLMRKLMFSTRHCRETQLKLLANILRENADTEYGKKHKFSKVDTLADFRNAVPINTYNDLERYIERHLKGEADVLMPGTPCYYATTSGSTGKSKFIPVTKKMEASSHEGSARLWSFSLYNNVPAAFAGSWVIIVSPAVEGYAPDGTPFGSISGQYIKNLSENIRKKYVVPYEVYEIKDYEARYYSILLLSMADDNVTLLSSTNPSTLSLLAKKGNEHSKRLLKDIRQGTLDPDLHIEPEIRTLVESRLRPDPQRADKLLRCMQNDPDGELKPVHYWPKLEAVACWTGGNSKVFLDKMKHWYGEVRLKDLGFLASEIRGSIPLTTESSEGVLTIDENFFEFVEAEKFNSGNHDYLLADELEVGKRYYLYFTNNAGLYRYDINDIVEVKGFVNGTPTIDFIQKGKGVTNITGEKIYEQQVLLAVQKAEEKHRIKLAFFQVQARVELSRYDLFCEFETDSLNKAKKLAFLQEVETQLQLLNLEYKTKRKSLRLDAMQLHVLAENSFETFKKFRVKQGVREAQLKTVPLSADFSLTESLKVVDVITIS